MGITPYDRDPTVSAASFDPSGQKQVIGITVFPPQTSHHKKERITVLRFSHHDFFHVQALVILLYLKIMNGRGISMVFLWYFFPIIC